MRLTMARMIPSFFDDSTAPGECDVFGWLGEGPLDWVVLHQLELAPWNRHRKTEIDFVVIMPRVGILCVEVKSHEKIWYDTQGWHLGNDDVTARGPFKQADDAVKTLGRRIAAALPQLRYVPIARCVIFPRAAFERPATIEYDERELLDRGRCLELVRERRFYGALEACLRGTIANDPHLPRLPATGMREGHLEELLAFLRPVQQRVPGAKQERQARRERVEQILKKQQRPVLQAASANPRVVVRGGAGAGKTWIALELARRAAEEGKRTGLFCFNRLIGEWIEQQLRPVPPGLVPGPFLRKVAEMVDIELPAGQLDPAFANEELPRQLLARLASPELREQVLFDCIILDEAQDILGRPTLFECFRALVRGGTMDGSWVLLGDFDHQVLGLPDARKVMTECLAKLTGEARPTVWALSDNCRNFEVVGKAALSFGGIDDEVYTGFLRGLGDGGYLRPHVYTSPMDQLRLLRGEIEYWKGRNFQPKDITILSLRPDDDCIAARLGPEVGPLRRLGQPGYCLSYGPIPEFKGMESEVIILTDIDLGPKGDEELRRDLFYTGVTRALFGVSILMTPATSAWVLG
jgi:hypothetical protein